jgi:REP element-mobilizing transposase RayT
VLIQIWNYHKNTSDMKTRSTQLDFPLCRPHGGKRTGAGRPNLSGLRGHQRRPILDSKHPVHVTLKLASGLPSLRRKVVFRCLRKAVQSARAKGLRVVHFAILSNHVHLILETSESTLRKPLQSLGISFAKRMNRLTNRTGAVLLDRYHLHVLKTPTETRRALAYVLTNEAKHRIEGGMRKGHARPAAMEVSLDPFSSAFRFRDWRVLMGQRVQFRISSWSEAFIDDWYDDILSEARTWLLKAGWMKAA